MVVSGVDQQAKTNKTAPSKTSARPDQMTVSLDGKTYTFTVAKGRDGSHVLNFRMREGDNLYRVSLAAREVQKKLPGVKVRQTTASDIASFNGIGDVGSVSLGQVVSVGISGPEHKAPSSPKSVSPKPVPPKKDVVLQGHAEAHVRRPEIKTVKVDAVASSDPADALALSFISEVRHKRTDAEALLIWKTVEKECEPYGIDPLLVLCLIARESRFNRFDQSDNGCIGLMQMHPDTAKKFGLSAEELTDIRKSIRAGVRYLAEDCNINDGAILALSGYNAGPDRAKKAIDQPFSHQFKEKGKVNMNTFDQTKHYLFCIFNAYEDLRAGDVEASVKHINGPCDQDELSTFIDKIKEGSIKLDPRAEVSVSMANR